MSFGWVGDRDLHAATDYLRSRPDVDASRIGAIGLSVGGEMLIHAAAHSDAFKAIVSEGGSGQSVRDDSRRTRARRDAILGCSPVTAATAALHQHAAAAQPEERDREDRTDRRLPRLRRERPGRRREEKPNKLLHAAAHEPKQIWEVPNGQHIAGITTEPAEYERRVIGFFDRTLLDPN